MKAGAAGYMTKGADLEEMVRAIKVVTSGQRYISPEIAQAMALKPYVGEEATLLDMLSERELQIMMMIVNCHKVQDVADKLCLSPRPSTPTAIEFSTSLASPVMWRWPCSPCVTACWMQLKTRSFRGSLYHSREAGSGGHCYTVQLP